MHRAETALATIFGAPARIELTPAPEGPVDTTRALVVGIGPVTDPAGAIHLYPRRNERPYFSQDVALVTSLADVF